MQTLVERERIDRPLYWHCGYTPEWRLLGRWVRAARREAA
jgi:hypothetical protein